MERRVQLAGGPDAARAARAIVDALAPSLPSALHDDLKLLVSELVTNAVRHAGATEAGRISLGLSQTDQVLRVEVEDYGPGFEPGPPVPRPDRTGGYGLVLVDRLSDRWGVEGARPTRVWFEMDTGRPSDLGSTRVTREARTAISA
jgi:anti-sigma regulatory factor (Ser/Thr protein kinase)